MPLLVTEAKNIFVGDDVSLAASKHRNLQSIKLATLEEMEQDLNAGGSVAEISVGGLGLKKLEVTLKLFGHDPQVNSKFRVYNTPFTVYGVLRDKDTGKPIELKALIWGRLGKLEQDEFKRGDMQGHDLAIREIMRYAVYYDEKEKYFLDVKTSEWRIDGVEADPDFRRILRIPGA